MNRRVWKICGVMIAALLVGAQFFRPERTNPPSDPSRSFAAIVKPPPEVVSAVTRSCGDCHSNGTMWPWYSRVAPASWLVASDVRKARAKLNFSDWNRQAAERGEKENHGGEEICEQVRSAKMPPRTYSILHPQAKLSNSEIAALCSLPISD